MGAFITFEGPEGAGKSTVARRIATRLSGIGHRVILTREPGGTPIGDQIRHILLAHHNVDMTPEAEILLFSASRAQLVRQVIRPALAEGTIVLCDRYADSTLAYQGYGRGLDVHLLRRITAFATDDLRPDLTVLLDVPPEVGLARRRQASQAGKEWNRLDSEELDFYRRVRAGYLALAQEEPARWRVVDAAGPLDSVVDEVWQLVRASLQAQGLKLAGVTGR
ncbi:MAG: dTMP kinase [Ardenticatenia bacterium]|nr:dTMP kinase [Ardenticatenia bacterium]